MRTFIATGLVLAQLTLVGCATTGAANPPGSVSSTGNSISASTPCAQWISDPMNVREKFVSSYWTNLSEQHVKKVIEIKDASCRGAEGNAEPGKEPAVGPFQPLVNEVISGTYG